MRKVVASSIMAAIAVLLVSCGSSPTSESSSDKNVAPAQVITLKMNGQTIEVNEGDTFQISIPTIPAQGFNWEPETLDSNILEQQGDALYQQNQGADEAGGNVILTFKAVGKGTTPLTLIYTQSRVNNPNAMYTQSFGVTINVK
jgi:predicted secreted protein